VIVIARLYILPITQLISEAVIAEGLGYISEEKRTRLHRFRHREDLLRGLWADLLLRSRIIEDLHMANADIRFELNAYGKPRLSGVNNYHFNISHAGEWVVCLMDSEPVGVDVELVKTMDMAVARSFFTEEEYRYIREAAQSRDQMQRFYHIWTAKESYIKAVGKGLSLPLQEFSVLTAEGVEGVKRLGGETWQLQSYDLNSEAYSLTACFKPATELNEVVHVNTNRILETLRSANR
jgi:4'-phosphopantetheinyl transferase